jgi:hypothetical protein
MQCEIKFQIQCNQDDILKFIQQILTSNNPQTTPEITPDSKNPQTTPEITPNSKNNASTQTTQEIIPNPNNISTQTYEEDCYWWLQDLIVDCNEQIVEEDDLPEVIQPPTLPTDRDCMPPEWANRNIKIKVNSDKGINKTTKKNGERIQTSTWLRHQNYKNADNLLEYWKLGGTFSDYKRDIKNNNIKISK